MMTKAAREAKWRVFIAGAVATVLLEFAPWRPIE